MFAIPTGLARPFLCDIPVVCLKQSPLVNKSSGCRAYRLSRAATLLPEVKENHSFPGSNCIVDAGVTFLANGVCVATLPNCCQFASLAIATKGGSRYQNRSNVGISNLLACLFQKSIEAQNPISVQYTNVADREVLIHNIRFLKRNFRHAFRFLASSVLRAQFSESHLEKAKEQVFQFNCINAGQLCLTQKVWDLIHAAAYLDGTLGLPHYCSEAHASNAKLSDVMDFLTQCEKPERLVIAGVGVRHSQLVEMAEEFFNLYPPTEMPNNHDPGVDAHSARKASYRGSYVYEPSARRGEWVNIAVGLESYPAWHRDNITVGLLQTMLGGGCRQRRKLLGAKDMSSRLYRFILCQSPWVYQIGMHNFPYMETGLFYAHATVHRSYVAKVVPIISQQLQNMLSLHDADELNRVRKKYINAVMRSAESCVDLCNRLCGMLLIDKQYLSPEQVCDIVNEITVDDMERVALCLLSSRPSIAVLGVPAESKVWPSLAANAKELTQSLRKLLSNN